MMAGNLDGIRLTQFSVFVIDASGHVALNLWIFHVELHLRILEFPSQSTDYARLILPFICPKAKNSL